MRSLLLPLALGTLLATGCDSSEAKKDDAEPAAKKDDAKPDDSRPEACQKAEACCKAMAKMDGSDASLICTGVQFAEKAEECDQFKKGYVMAIESKKAEVPAECQ